MNVFDAIKNRYSVRKYLDKDVEDSKLTAVLDAARRAPSASNRQEWRFIVVRDKVSRQLLKAAAKGQSFVGEAPVVIVCCAETDNHVMTCGQLCYPIDIAIAIDHMTLMAVELGLGTCWIGAFYEEIVKNLLGVPNDVRVVELLTLGYPSKEFKPSKLRLDIKRIVFNDRWPV